MGNVKCKYEYIHLHFHHRHLVAVCNYCKVAVCCIHIYLWTRFDPKPNASPIQIISDANPKPVQVQSQIQILYRLYGKWWFIHMSELQVFNLSIPLALRNVLVL